MTPDRFEERAFKLVRDFNQHADKSDRVLAEWIASVLEAVVLEEREACAKVCEDIKARWVNEETADMIAAAIRARGTP